MEVINKLISDRFTGIMEARGLNAGVDIFFDIRVALTPKDRGVRLRVGGDNKMGLAHYITDNLAPLLQQRKIKTFEVEDNSSSREGICIEHNYTPETDEPLRGDTHYQNAFAAAVVEGIENYLKDYGSLKENKNEEEVNKGVVYEENPLEETQKKYPCKYCGQDFDAPIKLATHMRKCRPKEQ